jgi:carbonic anhydrase
MSTTVISAYEALERLRAGNERFREGNRNIEKLVVQARLEELADGQNPFAVVLTCADSRVPVEIVFDQGIGDLFVIRVAGNVVAPSLVGSVEYAAAVLNTKLVVVMGHSRCGAVSATLDVLRKKGRVPSDNIRDIVDRIRPAAAELVMGDASISDELLLERAIRANVRASTAHLRHGSPLLERLSNDHELMIVGGEYDIATGVVEFFDFPSDFDLVAAGLPAGS